MNTEHVRLRTMTWKSVLDGGKYQHCSVRQAYDAEGEEGPQYLAWLYYQNANLSFCEEILQEIGITEDLRIEKPGKDDTKMRRWRRAHYEARAEAMSEESRMGAAKRHDKAIKNVIKAKKRNIDLKYDRTKGQMQVRNQNPKFLRK